MLTTVFDRQRGARPAAAQDKGRAWLPAIDIAEQEAAFVITADVPGVRPDDISIDVLENTLTLSGSRSGAAGDAQVRRRERADGHFSRRVNLPVDVDSDGVTASAKHGTLTITVPKAPRATPRRIVIDAA